ncbi:MAG: pro-sigmaK processing inhibitor BofA family protein [bacterium]|nr:pro-sigmaK processing inhibitor BofA family protein [bacterium]
MEQGMLLIVIVCAMIFGIIFLKKRTEWILNFLLRGIFGGILIYFANEVFTFFEAGIHVGINAASLLTCATLGFPGLFLLYGIMML